MKSDKGVKQTQKWRKTNTWKTVGREKNGKREAKIEQWNKASDQTEYLWSIKNEKGRARHYFRFPQMKWNETDEASTLKGQAGDRNLIKTAAMKDEKKSRWGGKISCQRPWSD